MADKPISCLTCPIFPDGVFVLEPGKDYRIGRTDEENHIVLPSKSVSRTHATVTCLPDGHFLYDLRSRNGTRVNGNTFDREGIVLRHQDRITIGPFDLTYNRVRTDLDTFLAEHGTGDLEGETDLHLEGGSKKATSELLAGRLKGSVLLETCQMLAQTQRDGVLRIRSRNRSGQLIIFCGKIAHVTGTKGRSKRETARALLGLRDGGHYSFTDEIPPAFERHLKKDPIPLLPLILDIYREWDEENKEAGGEPESS